MVFVGQGKSENHGDGAGTEAPTVNSTAKPNVVVEIDIPPQKTLGPSAPLVSPTPEVPHMVFVGNGSDNESKNQSIVDNDGSDEKVSVAVAGAGNSSGEVKIDEPKHVIVVKSNVTEFEDP